MYLRMHEWHFAIQLLITIFSVNISLIQRTHRHIPALVFNPACKEMSDFNWKVFTIQKWNLAHGISSQLLDPRPKCHLPTTASSTPDTEHTCEMLIFRVADLREILGAQYNPFSLFSPPPIDEWPLKRVISVAVNYPIGFDWNRILSILALKSDMWRRQILWLSSDATDQIYKYKSMHRRRTWGIGGSIPPLVNPGK